jgi:hypothetical protein
MSLSDDLPKRVDKADNPRGHLLKAMRVTAKKHTRSDAGTACQPLIRHIQLPHKCLKRPFAGV